MAKEAPLSTFTPAEIEFLNGQQLGRLATVNEAGEPRVVPVACRLDPEVRSTGGERSSFSRTLA